MNRNEAIAEMTRIRREMIHLTLTAKFFSNKAERLTQANALRVRLRDLSNQFPTVTLADVESR